MSSLQSIANNGASNQVTSQLKSLIERSEGIPQQLKQRFIQESTNVKYPFHFIAVLINEGVLNDEPNQQDPNFGWTVGFIVQLLMTMACSKGADAIIGLMKALEESGNVELASALRTWVEDELAVEADEHLRTTRKLETSVAHTGTELIDNVMSHVKDELMRQLAFKACNIAHSTHIVSNLAHQNKVVDEPNLVSTIIITCSSAQQDKNRVTFQPWIPCPFRHRCHFL